MPVPASVLEILQTNNITYQLKNSQSSMLRMLDAQLKQANAACAVKSMVLSDAQGQVQILLPADYIVDLTAIQNQFGRDLYALSDNDSRILIGQQNLASVPAIPQWQGLPTLVDAALMDYPTLWLDTGDAEQTLEIQQRDFRNMIKAAVIGELARPAPAVPSSTALDQKQILIALHNFTQLRIKQRIEETLELPPLPDTAQRIIQLRANPNSDISDLTSIIELDPPLAAQVVSWASSPYYSAPGKIKSVHDAIVRVLGFDMVMNLALGLSLSKSMKSKVMSPQQLNQYWRQAVITAATVESLVTSIAREHRPGFGLSYLSGLLSNFGYLILAEVFPPYFASVERHVCANSHLPAGRVEQHLIGVASCQLASWLLDSWNLPMEVTTAIRHQHTPDFQGRHAQFVQVLQVAQQLLVNKGGLPGQFKAVPAALYQQLHLPRDTAEITVENILESCDELHSLAALMQG